MKLLNVSRIDVELQGRKILEDVSFHADSGEILGILGGSGSGKTTLLRAIAGFTPVEKGAIQILNTCMSCGDYTTPPHKRRVGIVFQDWALFPHLNVCKNVTFGIAGGSSALLRAECDRLLKLVGLSELHDRYPHEISGGQQQRVALARALAARPKLLLMDEAFSNLDILMREKLCVDVRDLLKSEGITTVVVTHYPKDLEIMADRVLRLDGGRVL